MFQPNDFQPPVAQIPPLFTTQEEYCAIAVVQIILFLQIK